MVIDSDFPPVPQAPLDDLLLECLEALRGSGYDGEHRESHIRFLDEISADSKLQDNLRDLLKEVANKFRQQRGVSPIYYMAQADEQAEHLADALAEALGGVASRYVYHGTIFGNLEGIAKEGLVPGRRPVWSEKLVPRKHCDSGVFLASSWRGATNWADMAHRSSRGPRNGKHRTPCVIRVPREGLILEPDQYRAGRSCMLVRGNVQLIDPCVILGQVLGFPIWRPLSEVLATK